MAKHVIEFDQECDACNATGLYVGIGERDGAAVVCLRCEGTGRLHTKITYRDFEERKVAKKIKRVYQYNPDVVIGEGFNARTNKEYKLEDFGGVPYKDWLRDGKFPEKSEMRNASCPQLWYQNVDYDKIPRFKECDKAWGRSITKCPYYNNKEECWKRWDEKYGNKQ